ASATPSRRTARNAIPRPPSSTTTRTSSREENDMKRRTALIAAIALSVAPGLAFAQAFPSKPIRLVNPFSAGGGLDQLARNIAQKMTESLGQPVVVENRTGASGNIGAELVSKEKGDGYVLLMGSSATHGTSPALYGPRLPFDPIKD